MSAGSSARGPRLSNASIWTTSRRAIVASVQSAAARSRRPNKRELEQVVAFRDPPAERPANVHAEHVGDPLLVAERRHLAERGVPVRAR